MTRDTPPQQVRHAAEFKAAIQDFTRNVRDFQGDIATRLQQQEERLAMIERKHAAPPRRPALETAAADEAPYAKAFAAYLRHGEEDRLRGLEMEHKGLSTVLPGDGGFLVDPQTAEEIRSVLHGAGSLRSVANVVQVMATAYDVLVDTTEGGAGWADETAARGETDPPQVERISIPLHELSALPKASQRLLDDAAFDVESWLAGRIAERFARAEGAAFVSGDGAGKPTGFLHYPFVPEAEWEWEKLGYVATGAAGDFSSTNAADSIVDLVYALGARYRANASFVMNSKTAGAVRKMKDADGRFLWSDGLAAGEPARLMGYPVLIVEEMPDIANGAAAVAFGDFRAGYTIAERPEMRLLRDPYSAKPHVLFYATRRVGGDVSDFAAIKLLRFSLA
ncbi:MAG: phage major capsid protein [Rhodobacteraceae bacterium]|nr:phage major capsid protein [Paracoccaceae bacterium]